MTLALSPAADILWRLAAIVAAAVVIVITGLLVRRKMMHGDASGNGEAFSLHDLRELHRRGDLSDEQFQRARAALLARSRARLEVDGQNGADSSDNDSHGVA